MLNVCQAMAEWVMFKTDLWDFDTMYPCHVTSQVPNIFGLSTVSISQPIAIASQPECCPERSLLGFEHAAKNSKVHSSCVYSSNCGMRKVKRKGTSGGWIS